ncbi:hypothetical protein [Alteromonas sp. H39]|uniref:hypothetical protein n=1 Tax=Alteromonas sp. H39 TaxID=3389876 RepID=UPI0039E1968E
MYRYSQNALTGSARYVFPLFLAFLLVGLSTNWTFNLFAPQFLWKAYNYYFLSIIDGHLDIPVEAIGREGGYFDGKAYMYYGLLPALARVVLYPFVDLTQTPTSLFCIMLFTLIGLSVLQRELNRALLPADAPLFSQTGMVWGLVTTVSWVGSATFMISQGGTIYHEPYAASLCLFNIFMAMLIKDGFFQTNTHRSSPLIYAVLAALAIHTRMPMALALYFATGLIMLVMTYRSLSSAKPAFYVLPFQAIKHYYGSLIILLVGGLSIFLLNYAKYGDPMSFMGGNYGYSFLEGFSDRKCRLVPSSEYKRFLRIIANSYIYLTGDWERHWSLTWHLKTGYGRWELPLTPLGVLWALPVLSFAAAVVVLLKKVTSRTHAVTLLGLFFVSLGALYQLSYPTITHRYTAELWAPFFCALLWLAYVYRNHKLSKGVTGVAIVAGLIGIGYQLHLATSDKYYLENGPIYKHDNYHYSDEDHAFLSQLTEEAIAEHKAQEKLLKKEACKKLAEEIGIDHLLKKKN